MRVIHAPSPNETAAFGTASLLSFQRGINVPGYAASTGAQVNAIAPGDIATDNGGILVVDGGGMGR